MEKRCETSLSLRDYLRQQLRSSYRDLAKAIGGLSEAQAREGARAGWRRYRWGVGLDGSIAGIVWHAAAWKQIFVQGLETGIFPAEGDVVPPAADWAGLQVWLADGQARLEAAFDRLSDDDLAAAREWEGETAPVLQLLTYLIEHDIYHAGQVELLRQLRRYPRGAD